MCHWIFDTFPRFRTNRHFDAFVLKISQSVLTPFWSGPVYTHALTSLMKKRNSKGKITVDLLKPISVSNPLFSREIFCSGFLNQISGWQCERAIRWAWCEKLERCSEKRMCWNMEWKNTLPFNGTQLYVEVHSPHFVKYHVIRTNRLNAACILLDSVMWWSEWESDWAGSGQYCSAIACRHDTAFVTKGESRQGLITELLEPAGSCLSLGHLSLRVDLGWSARAGE